MREIKDRRIAAEETMRKLLNDTNEILSSYEFKDAGAMKKAVSDAEASLVRYASSLERIRKFGTRDIERHAGRSSAAERDFRLVEPLVDELTSMYFHMGFRPRSSKENGHK